MIWTAGAPKESKENPKFPEYALKICQRFDELAKIHGFKGARCHIEALCPSQSLGGYYANSDKERATLLKEVFFNPDTKAIWCGRGGYGSSEILEIFEQEGFHPPSDRTLPIIGFSDITALHLWACKYGWPFFHAPMINFNKEMADISNHSANIETSVKQMMDILKGEIQEVNYNLSIINPDSLKNQPHEFFTTVLGGNLSVIQRNNGTLTALDAKSAVLFFEDTESEFNTLNSLLCSLSRSGSG